MRNAASICLSILFSVTSAWAETPAVPPQGYVYANLPSEHPGVSITLSSIPGNKEYTLEVIKETTLPERGAWIPEGDYRLRKIGGLGLEGFPSIPVKAGRMTDLGNFVFFHVGVNKLMLLPIRQPSLAPFSKRALDRISGKLSDATPILWKVDRTPDPFMLPEQWRTDDLIVNMIIDLTRREEFTPLLKRYQEVTDAGEFLRLAKEALPPRNLFPESDPEGNLYFGTSVGQIRCRSANGKWSTLDTGSLYTVGSVYCHEGALYAGLRYGVILKSPDKGKTWSEWASISPEFTVVDVKRLGSRWIVVGFKPTDQRQAGTNTEIAVFEGNAETPGALTKTKEFTGNTDGTAPVHGQVWKDAYYLSVAPNVHKLEAPTMTWQTLTMPVKPVSFRIHPKTGVMTAFSLGFASKMANSADLGATWKKTKTPPNFAASATFSAPAEGHAIRLQRGSKPSLELYYYEPLIENWVKMLDGPKGYDRFFLDQDTKPFFVLSGSGSIQHFNGDKFEAEFTVE